MHAARLERIAFLFPTTTPDERAWWAALVQLLGQLSQADILRGEIVFAPLQPRGALPITSFAPTTSALPQLVFTPALPLDLTIGGLQFDSAQPISLVQNGGATTPPAVASLQELADRLQGQLTRFDHSGVNMPTSALDRSRWDALMEQCAAMAALYRYPGEDWPFILPATEAELASDIHDFVLGREPKFEFVYDRWTGVPILQFSLDTRLSRAELEARFPAPEGCVLPGLEEIFRTVYVMHPWPELVIRIDLNYRAEGGANDWGTGEWLIAHGGRWSYS